MRAVLLAMWAVEADRDDAASGLGLSLGCTVGPHGLAYLDAVLVLLRVRLTDAAVLARAWDEPVPYLLTDAGVAAVQRA